MAHHRGHADGPMTEAQEGIWFAQRVDPANPVFNTAQYVEIHGALDVAAFEQAVNATMVEADGLAVCVQECDGSPVLRPFPGCATLEVVDLRARENAVATAMDAMQRDIGTAIDLSLGGLARQTLFRVSDSHAFWYQRVHHIVIDGYGTALLTERVCDLYAASQCAGAGTQSFRSNDVVEEADRIYRFSENRERDRQFWLTEFADAEPARSLTNHAALTSSRYVSARQNISAEAAGKLRALTERVGTTWPDTLVAITAAYVQRHTGGNSVTLGLPTMNRLGTPGARVPAMVMNVLPVRIAVDEGQSVAEFVQAVAKRLRGLRKHSRYRSEQLRRDLGILGVDRRLFGPMVNVLPFDGAPSIPGTVTRLHTLATGPVDDITFSFRSDASAAGIELEIDANPALYTERDVEAHLLRLSEFLTIAVDAELLRDIPTTTAAERARLLSDFNATAHPVAETTLAALIEQAMIEFPDRTALRFGNRDVTYKELSRATAMYGHELMLHGVKRGDVVGVAMERSLEMLVAFVAILRIGAAYLPVEATHPADRIGLMLDVARARLLVVGADTHVSTDAVTQMVMPSVDALMDRADIADIRPDESGPSPSDAAYVLYTSGSTGAPKGVVVEHRAIVNRLEWMRHAYAFNETDRFLQKTPVTFDVSVWELFLPLMTGACLVIAPPDAHRDPAAIVDLLRRESVSAVHFVPSMLSAFLDEPSAAGVSVARVFCSGEELKPEHRDRFYEVVRGELHNLYGPTEAAVDVTYWHASSSDRSRPVPIGRPVWNTQMYILDAELRPVPEGVPGTLYIAGVQLARGYVGRDDLTAERFVPNPFVPGARMYNTGDLAQWRNDGAIEYLGRIDGQVKLRGQRLEVGEIESVLLASPFVAQAAVVLREDKPGDQRLVAYFVPKVGAPASGALSSTSLRDVAAQKLPDFMIPSAFVALDELPLTSSGKLDRKRLPRVASQHVEVTAAIASPLEQHVADAFAHALELPAAQVGADSDFFLLGGHSLLAVRAIAFLRDRFQIKVGLGVFFAQPTPRRIAQHLTRQHTAQSGLAHASDFGLDSAIQLSQGNAEGALFCIHPAGGISWGYAALARALGNRTVYGIQASGISNPHAAVDSMRQMALDYVAVVKALQPVGPYHLAGWSVGGIIAQAMAVELQRLGDEVGVVALIDAYPSDHWRNAADPGPGAAIKALMLIAGYDPAELPRLAVTEAEAIAWLRSVDHPLGTLSDSALEGVMRVVGNNNANVRGHATERVAAPLLHFRASIDPASLRFSPDDWAPYCDAVERVDVPSLHAHMIGATSSQVIAEVLRTRLDDRARKAVSAEALP
ncbi:MAG: amino acid adenylation domain-containing protein [Gemmatimonas sp.]